MQDGRSAAANLSTVPLWPRVLAAAAVAAVVVSTFGASAAEAPAPRTASALPAGAAVAAHRAEPTLPTPRGWSAPDDFSRTSGTGRLIGGALEWTDWVYDAYGAADPTSPPNSITQNANALSPAKGSYVYPSSAAHNNGADIFRAAVGLNKTATIWRVDWNTLADAKVPIAEWTFDTDDNPKTGRSPWPAGANVHSAGIELALVVSAAGARLVDVPTGRMLGRYRTIVDTAARSFVVTIPRRVLPLRRSWRVRLAAGLADATGTSFAVPTRSGGSVAAADAPRVYNVTFRIAAQEPPRYVASSTSGAAAAADAAQQSPVIGAKGVGAAYNLVTANFWAEAHQADALRTGDVSPFSQVVDWKALAQRLLTQPPLLRGWSDRWYVTSLNLGQGVADGSNADPAYLGRVQPYAVYVPRVYDGRTALPLTWTLHSASVNYNQYDAVNPRLVQQVCEDRGSVCASPEGFGANGLYMGDAENDFWSVWREVAEAYAVRNDRTVVTGYSMGGLGSFTLPATYPSVFSESMPLDGGFDDRCTTAPAGLANFDMLAAADRSANVHWVPYVISDSYTDELSPYPNNAELVRRMSAAENRFTLFSTTMPEHITTDSADGFSLQVDTLRGTPLAKQAPGSIDYTWCADVGDPKLGLGPTAVYWLSGLRQRSADSNAISHVVAVDGALPERDVVEQVTASAANPPDAPPMQVITGTPVAGARPAATGVLRLTLTNVAALTVDTAAAKLPIGEAIVTSDGAALVTLAHLQRGGSLTIRIKQGTTRIRW